ncbi:MAG: type IV pilin N-terminal domain-containing protein [Methanoregula sp.]|jgi:hypothetical protein|nr:type IV pilin N-terminal domain-containing protein [Methanoregula sp.]
MSSGEGKKAGMDSASGVSEIIGVILMIALVVAAVALIAVMLTSQSTPQEIPNINFMTGLNADGTELYLYHNGGDALRRGEFAIVTDIDPAPRTDYTISDGSDEWTIGRNLILPVTSPPKTVAVVYTSGSSGGGVVIKSGSSGVAVLKETIRPDATPVPVGGSGGSSIDTSDPQNVVNYILTNTSLIGDAMNQSPSTVGPVIANVVGANSTSFYRSGSNTLNQGTYFLFRITGSGSTISYGSSSVKYLDPGDIVEVKQTANNPGEWKVFGIGDQIWEFSAEKVDVNWKKQSTGTWLNSSGTTLYHTRISGYSDVGSTLTIQTSNPQNQYTALVINGVKLIEDDNDHTVVIREIRPVGLGLFILEYDFNTGAVYFVGHAEDVIWS